MAKIRWVLVAGLAAGACVFAAPPSPDARVQSQMVLTVLPGANGNRPQTLVPGDVQAFEGKMAAPVIRIDKLARNLSDVQLFIYLDDSTPAVTLGTQIPELKHFVESLPASTQVAIGYMRNGTFALAQGFTTDHQKAARSIRLSLGEPGGNGSPYFALEDLVKHWPSQQPGMRRSVLMLTDGVDRYYGAAIPDDPYLDAAVSRSLEHGIMVYSIYFRDAGRYGRGGWVQTMAQSRLQQLCEDTGGTAYFQALTSPVSVTPYLQDMRDRLENQYQMIIDAPKPDRSGVQPVTVRTESPSLKVQAPKEIYVR